MKQFTVEQFQKNFDELIERITQGESFIINSGKGSVAITPYKTCQEADGLLEYLRNHNDGC